MKNLWFLGLCHYKEWSSLYSLILCLGMCAVLGHNYTTDVHEPFLWGVMGPSVWHSEATLKYILCYFFFLQCSVKHCKCSCLKQHTFIILEFLWVKSQMSKVACPESHRLSCLWCPGGLPFIWGHWSASKLKELGVHFCFMTCGSFKASGSAHLIRDHREALTFCKDPLG